MNTKPTPKMIDARPSLFAWIGAISPSSEFTTERIEREHSEGFAVAEDATLGVILHGPLETSTTVPSREDFDGIRRVKGLALLQAIARLVECGPPIWEKSLDLQADWWRGQIRGAGELLVEPREEFRSREELENHASSCSRCQPSFRMLVSALELGSNRHDDKHLRELIEKSHADQEAAVQFYTQIRDSQRAPFMTLDTKPRKREQVVA